MKYLTSTLELEALRLKWRTKTSMFKFTRFIAKYDVKIRKKIHTHVPLQSLRLDSLSTQLANDQVKLVSSWATSVNEHV